MLRIERQASPRCAFSSEELSARLDENAALVKDLNLNKGITSSSSSFASFNSSSSEDEEGEEVNQLVLNKRGRVVDHVVALAVLIAASVVLILALSSNFEDYDNLAFTPLWPVGEDVITHSYSESYGSDTSSKKSTWPQNSELSVRRSLTQSPILPQCRTLHLSKTLPSFKSRRGPIWA
ncbi:hypothetical protein Acr_00g0044810 [Actinidia rufa]|uniref:Uncharacterized protein n=1 Tax=Actinidia rufa TaxID=165716 RepID=A0A7J0DJ02_9ERIC|nr:hypothetical protein Acr_00g0044810 [Actinidia rufa]